MLCLINICIYIYIYICLHSFYDKQTLHILELQHVSLAFAITQIIGN